MKMNFTSVFRLVAGVAMMGVSSWSYGQNVGINATGAAPDASATLDVSATNKGFLAPRVADTNAIAAPVEALIIYDLSSHCYRYYTDVEWTPCLFGVAAPTAGTVATIDCAGAAVTGSLEEAVAASGVSFDVNYTAGDGNAYTGEAVASTGVTGLTATLGAGSFASGAGAVTYTVTGTPVGSGTASFTVNIGGQSCAVDLTVTAAGPVATYCAGTPTAVVDVTSTTGAIWMDRNLGASQAATSSTDATAYGDLYQWGRFTDGHQCRTSNTISTNAVTETPGHGDFILEGTSPFDWLAPQNDNLWQGAAGTNNPCPGGYRLPTETELETERLAWGTNNTAGAFASPLKLPVAGYRNASNGSVGNVGSNGYYWSSTVSGTTARRLYFNSSNAGVGTNNRAGGRSVRCIKD